MRGYFGLTLAGLAIGLALSAVALRLMTTVLYGFRPDYISTATVVSFILLGVATLACLGPTRIACGSGSCAAQ